MTLFYPHSSYIKSEMTRGFPISSHSIFGSDNSISSQPGLGHPSKVHRTESMASLWWTCRPLVSFSKGTVEVSTPPNVRGRLWTPRWGNPQKFRVHHEALGFSTTFCGFSSNFLHNFGILKLSKTWTMHGTHGIKHGWRGVLPFFGGAWSNQMSHERISLVDWLIRWHSCYLIYWGLIMISHSRETYQ